MRVLFFAFLIFISSHSFASIPSARMILQRVVDNSGSGSYLIEQEVQFNSGSESINLKETWAVTDHDTLRLTVSGTKELADQIKMQYFYSGNNRWELSSGKRLSKAVSKEFLERIFFHRNLESLGSYLIHNEIIPEGSLAKKLGGKKSADFNYQPEKFLRLSRFGGVVNYAFGNPTDADAGAHNPGLWVEQDQFVIRKIVLPSQVEMVADNFNTYAKGLTLPKQKTVSFGNDIVQLKTLSVVSRGNLNSLMTPNALDTESRLEGITSPALKKTITEFYERFR